MSAIGQLKWKCDGMFGSNLTLMTRNKECIARFDKSVLSMHEMGKFIIFDSNIQNSLLDEIIISDMTMVEEEEKKIC